MNLPPHEHRPPVPECRRCQLAGLVPFTAPPPPGWVAPAGSPAAAGVWPKPRVSIAELAARKRH